MILPQSQQQIMDKIIDKLKKDPRLGGTRRARRGHQRPYKARE